MKKYETLRDLVEDGEEPKNTEYIFMCWGDDPRIEVGIVVTNVKLCPSEEGGYTFIDKETGKEMHTNYAWALMENTPENIVRINEWKEKCNVCKEAERIRDLYRRRIRTLEKYPNLFKNAEIDGEGSNDK